MPAENLESADPPSLVSRQTAWRLVLIMTTLLVLALIAVVWGFVRQAKIALAAPAPAAVATPAPAAVLTLAPGDHIVSATTDAGKLVLRLNNDHGGGEVQIIDLASGKLTARIVTETVPGK